MLHPPLPNTNFRHLTKHYTVSSECLSPHQRSTSPGFLPTACSPALTPQRRADRLEGGRKSAWSPFPVRRVCHGRAAYCTEQALHGTFAIAEKKPRELTKMAGDAASTSKEVTTKRLEQDTCDRIHARQLSWVVVGGACCGSL